MSPSHRPNSRTAHYSRRSMSPSAMNHPSGDTNIQLGSPTHPAIQSLTIGIEKPLSSASTASTLVQLPFTSPAVSQSATVLKKLVGRHVLNVAMFNKDELHALFNLAQFFRMSVHKDRRIDSILRVIFPLIVFIINFLYK
jgi:hypothetical protein